MKKAPQNWRKNNTSDRKNSRKNLERWNLQQFRVSIQSECQSRMEGGEGRKKGKKNKLELGRDRKKRNCVSCILFHYRFRVKTKLKRRKMAENWYSFHIHWNVTISKNAGICPVNKRRPAIACIKSGWEREEEDEFQLKKRIKKTISFSLSLSLSRERESE